MNKRWKRNPPDNLCYWPAEHIPQASVYASFSPCFSRQIHQELLNYRFTCRYATFCWLIYSQSSTYSGLKSSDFLSKDLIKLLKIGCCTNLFDWLNFSLLVFWWADACLTRLYNAIMKIWEEWQKGFLLLDYLGKLGCNRAWQKLVVSNEICLQNWISNLPQ